MFDILWQLDFEPFALSLKLASITTALLFVFSVPLAWHLSQTTSKTKPLLEALTALPIVLPPSVIGFYILVALSQNSPLGAFFKDVFGVELVFNFSSLVIASCFYSLPFMVQPLQNGFESLNKNMLEASYLAGKTTLQTLLKVALPNIKPQILTATIITFAHTVGEFGVVLMVGGSIAGETKVASVAIYEMVETLEYQSAHIYSALMIGISFVVLVGVYFFNARWRREV